jgi:phosphopantetheine--protein transferase-like protein
MVHGVGIDAVSIAETRRLMTVLDSVFERHTFTAAELAQSQTATDQAEYLAGRFAVKEAVFKAVAHLTPDGSFDPRVVTCLDGEDGRPTVVVSGELRTVLDAAAVSRLLVSITHEGDLAIAMVLAQG